MAQENVQLGIEINKLILGRRGAAANIEMKMTAKAGGRKRR